MHQFYWIFFFSLKWKSPRARIHFTFRGETSLESQFVSYVLLRSFISIEAIQLTVVRNSSGRAHGRQHVAHKNALVRAQWNSLGPRGHVTVIRVLPYLQSVQKKLPRLHRRQCSHVHATLGVLVHTCRLQLSVRHSHGSRPATDTSKISIALPFWLRNSLLDFQGSFTVGIGAYRFLLICNIDCARGTAPPLQSSSWLWCIKCIGYELQPVMKDRKPSNEGGSRMVRGTLDIFF